MKKVSMLLVAVAMFLAITSSAHAALILRGTDTWGYQLIYDTDLNITWYDYTAPLDTWQNQMNWASSLTVDYNGTTYDDWRLPTALNKDGTGPCENVNCTGSEMGHLFYTELKNIYYGPAQGLWNTSFTDDITGNSEKFKNLQTHFYWSSTEYAPDPDFAWAFFFYQGYQTIASKVSSSHALAVRDGDVAAAGVPEPATMLLFGAGLAGFGLMKSWRRAL